MRQHQQEHDLQSTTVGHAVGSLVACCAGSERNKLSGATGEHFKEACSIRMKCWRMLQSASHWAMLWDHWLLIMQAVSATS